MSKDITDWKELIQPSADHTQEYNTEIQEFINEAEIESIYISDQTKISDLNLDEDEISALELYFNIELLPETYIWEVGKSLRLKKMN